MVTKIYIGGYIPDSLPDLGKNFILLMIAFLDPLASNNACGASVAQPFLATFVHVHVAYAVAYVIIIK
jgi:hypothetical protein